MPARDSVARRRIAERIVEAHLSLCDTLAGRYRGRGVDHDDLVQVARMALWLAIERYRADQGDLHLLRHPDHHRGTEALFPRPLLVIRPPRHLQELRASAVAQRSELEQCLGRELGVDELAHQMDVCARELRAALDTSDSYQPACSTSPTATDRANRSARRCLPRKTWARP